MLAGATIASGATTAVAADVADAAPLEFDAVTVRRSVAPASGATSEYEAATAPLIDVQLAAEASQRFHW